MIKEKRCGVVDLVNPGQISENRLFALFQRYMLPDLRWETIDTREEIQHLSTSSAKPEGELAKMLYVEESLQEYIFAPNNPDQDNLPHSIGFCGLTFGCMPLNCLNVYDSCQSSLNHV